MKQQHEGRLEKFVLAVRRTPHKMPWCLVIFDESYDIFTSGKTPLDRGRVLSNNTRRPSTVACTCSQMLRLSLLFTLSLIKHPTQSQADKPLKFDNVAGINSGGSLSIRHTKLTHGMETFDSNIAGSSPISSILPRRPLEKLTCGRAIFATTEKGAPMMAVVYPDTRSTLLRSSPT